MGITGIVTTAALLFFAPVLVMGIFAPVAAYAGLHDEVGTTGVLWVGGFLVVSFIAASGAISTWWILAYLVFTLLARGRL